MALKLELNKDEFDKLDEGLRGLYEEKNGAYTLGVEGIEDTSGLKSALSSERKKASELEKAMKQWTATGKKPEEVAEILRHFEDEEMQRAKDKGEYDRIIAQMKKKSADDAAAGEEKLGAMRNRLASYLIDAEATRILSENGGNTMLLLPHVKNSTKVVEDNGKCEVRVIGDDGTPRVNSKGEYLTIKDLVEEMKQKEVFQCAFAAGGKSGGGAGGSGGTGAGGMAGNPFKQETWNLTEQFRIYKENPTKAAALAKEAGVAWVEYNK